MLGGVLVCLGALTQADSLLDEEEFSSSLPVERTVLPPAFRVVPARSVDAFFEDTRELQTEVDALAKEKP